MPGANGAVGVLHTPCRGELNVGDLGIKDRPGPAGPSGEVGGQAGSRERGVGLLEGEEPGGEAAKLGPGEPGAHRAEVAQPDGVSARRPGPTQPGGSGYRAKSTFQSPGKSALNRSAVSG
jgi:hypothetical protein